MSDRPQEIYKFGEFSLDAGEHRINRTDGRQAGTLPEKAFQTLLTLLRNNGRLVSKEELFSSVWGDTIVEENNLGKAIHSIRRFLGESDEKNKYIETVPKHGYRFIAPVDRADGDGPEVRPPTAFPNRSPAFDLYIRGKVKAGSENIDDTADAIKVLEAAVAIDPLFAPAYAQLARAYNTRAFKFSPGRERKLLHENADVAVEKALSIDPDLAEGHFARGLILWTNTKGFPHEQAIQAYKRSLALNPNYDEAHHQLSMIYAHTGLMKEAHSELQQALELNPNNTMARFRKGVYYSWEGKYEEALAALKSVPDEVSPMLVGRVKAEVLIHLGRNSQALMLANDYLASHPQDEGGSFWSVKAILFAIDRDHEKVEASVARAIKIGKDFGHFHHTACNIASAYAILGRADEAVQWIENAADDGFPNYTYFDTDPNLDAIRSDVNYIVLMSRLAGQRERLAQVASA